MTTSSNISFIIFLLSITTLVAATTTTTTNTEAEKTCKAISTADPQINYSFCINAFKSVPESATANITGLGLISLKLLKDNVTNTLSLVNHLINHGQNESSFELSALQQCQEAYSEAVYRLENAVPDYEAKHFDDFLIKVSAVSSATTACEDGFDVFHITPPSTLQTNSINQLLFIVQSIVQSLS